MLYNVRHLFSTHRTDIDSFLIPSSLHPADDGPAGAGGGGRHEGGSGNTPTLQSLTTPESSLNPAAGMATNNTFLSYFFTDAGVVETN